MTGLRQEFCVRWNSHLGSIGAAFPQLLAGQRFVDVTLACEGHQLHCHRLVLAACSSYFESILAENPCKHPVIILPSDVKLWEIQALIDFMYKGEVNVTQAGLPNLLRCAESLRIRGLYGSDAALNINQLKMMTQNKLSSATGNAAPIANNVGTTTTTAASNATVTDDADAEMMTTVADKDLNESEGKRHSQQSSAIVAGAILNGPTVPSAAAANHSQIRKQQQQQQQQQTQQSANQPQQLQHNFQQQIQMQKQIEQQQLQLQQQQQQQQQLLSNQSIKNENYATESADDSTSTFDNYEEYGIKGEIMQEEDSFTGANDEEDSYSGENDNENTLAAAQNASINHQHSSSYKRVRRADELLAQAARCVSKGQTYQTASNMFNIPVSTLRFHMARKGILPVRKRGRGAASVAAVALTQLNAATHQQQQQQQQQNNARHHHHQQQQQQQEQQQLHLRHQMKSSSHSPPIEPPFHMVGYQLPEQKQNII